MFYRPQEGHGLPHNPFNAIVSPRPIGWISTRADGHDNLAPYSFFNAVACEPPQVMFASTGSKDSLNNIQRSACFAVNLVGQPQLHAMNASAAMLPAEVDEFDHAGLQKAQCHEIDCPYVVDAPAVLECRVTQVIALEGAENHAIFGRVVGVHIRPDCLADGRFDVTRAALVSRLGYRDYARIADPFELPRPGGD